MTSLTVSSILLIVFCLTASSGKQEMITATELPGHVLLNFKSKYCQFSLLITFYASI